ncbi:aldehyde dehydrogenase family protein [Desulfovibrio ferrophilus]|uniref:Betaine aldehyde dehydrogenase n=1 Tax=Desulfovibrio ferrophilus TaxID=241368 RepID=A0A2Z6B3D2_9BACT|nr:aldehyde dehydrogenase family protein [Desulfovibrio ferrophilus]BBD10044.1 betaine aldehyde dehydrogenase [Desulfovibrio ferrophilus]
MNQGLFINGQWTTGRSTGTREIINPFNREVIATVVEATRKDTQDAIAAARAAFDSGPWPRFAASERAALVRALGDAVEQHREELAHLESLDTGKTLEESRWDMDDIAGIFRYYADIVESDMADSAVQSPIKDSTSTIVREPVGVCGQISPWNYPLLQASWKMAPALAAGCTIIMKPSEITPLTTIRITELAQEVGFPPGVVNLVLGAGHPVGAELAESLDVDLISFTGGIETGRKIMQAASGNAKKIALELGGKNPHIVFADADIETAVDYALNAVFFHAGQICSAGARLLLESSIHDDFVSALRAKMERIVIGNGMVDGTQMGPLISEQHRDKVERAIKLGQEEGATVLTGGKRPDAKELENGFFVTPTLFTNCTSEMRIVQEEVFGPVITVERFETEEEAIILANDTTYGLSAGFWTTDTARQQRVSRALRFGTVWINDFNVYFVQAPWGGYKQSGIGRELGRAGLEEYLETKHVFQNLTPKSLNWFGG